MSTRFPVAATLRLRNGHLYRILQARGWTQHDLAEYLDVSDIMVSHWMRFRSPPRDPAILRKLMDLTGVAAADLFPDRLYKNERPVTDMTVVRDVDVRMLASRPGGVLALPSLEDVLAAQDTAKLIAVTLDTLTPKERDIIKRRFGLGGREPETLEEIGRTYAVSKSRIREIEAQGLRKLQHPALRRHIYER